MNKNFNVRILNKLDTYANWIANDPTPMAGEICIATVPAETGAVAAEPAVIIKVGDGTNKYSALPILSGLAADVHTWAKAAQKPVYAAAEITGIDKYIADYVNEQMGISVDTDTQYKIEKVNEYNYKLQSKGKTDQAWTDVENGNIVIPKYDDTAVKADITALQGLVGETGVAAQIAEAITKLNLADTYEAKGAAAQALTDAKAYTDAQKVDYTVKVVESTPEGYAKAYTITQTASGLNATINIPKDMVVQSGTVETKSEEGAWGAVGTYLVLTLANATSDKVYINVGTLIEYVTSGSQVGDQIQIAVSGDHKVTATLSDGSVTKAQLKDDVQATLGKADTALQKADIVSGTNNGTISVGGADVAVKGLGSAAYTESDAYDTKGSASTAEANAKSHAQSLIDALSNTDAAVDKQFVTAVKETAGVVTVERKAVADVAITGSFADLVQNPEDTIVFNCGTSK